MEVDESYDDDDVAAPRAQKRARPASELDENPAPAKKTASLEITWRELLDSYPQNEYMERFLRSVPPAFNFNVNVAHTVQAMLSEEKVRQDITNGASGASGTNGTNSVNNTRRFSVIEALRRHAEVSEVLVHLLTCRFDILILSQMIKQTFVVQSPRYSELRAELHKNTNLLLQDDSDVPMATIDILTGLSQEVIAEKVRLTKHKCAEDCITTVAYIHSVATLISTIERLRAIMERMPDIFRANIIYCVDVIVRNPLDATLNTCPVCNQSKYLTNVGHRQCLACALKSIQSPEVDISNRDVVIRSVHQNRAQWIPQLGRLLFDARQ